MRLLKAFDFFGTTFNPTVAYNEKNNSVLGAVFGIFYIIIAIMLTYTFGWVLIEKNRPAVSTQTIINYDKRSNYSLPFAINNNTYPKPSVRDINLTRDEVLQKGKFLGENIARVYDISFLFSVNINNRGIKFTKELQMNKCNPRDFTQKAESSNDFRNIDDSNCFHRSTLAGENFDLLNAGEFEYRKVIIETNNCENSTGIKEDCLSKEQQHFFFTHFVYEYHYYYPVISFDAKNFLKPFADEVEHKSIKLIINPQPFLLTQKISVQDNLISTDSGVFTEYLTGKYMQSIKTIKFVLGESLKDFDYSNDVKRQKFHRIEFNLAAASIDIVRSYPKLQTILAQLIGMLYIINWIFKSFLQNIYEHQTKELLLHQIFHVTEPLINELELRKKQELSGNEMMKIEDDSSKPQPGAEKAEGNNASEVDAQQGNKIIDISSIVLQPNDQNNSSSLKESIKNLDGDNIMIPNDLKGKKSVFASYLQRNYIDKDKVGKELRAKKSVQNSMEVTKNMTKKQIPKKNYSLTNKSALLLSLGEHICLVYLCCCVSERTQKIENFYQLLNYYMKDYTDICNITNNIYEMEKMKYLLMDEDQASIFSLRTKIHVKENLQKHSNNFSTYYYFLRDLNDFVDIDGVKMDILKRENQKTMNRRLINTTI